MNSQARVLVEDLPQRHRGHRGDPGPFGVPRDGQSPDDWLLSNADREIGVPGKDQSDPRKRGTPNEGVRNKANLQATTGAGADGRGRQRNRRWDRLYKQTQSTDAGEQSCETKPIPCGRVAMAEGRRGRPCRYCGAKTCETKPIPRERRRGHVLCGKRVMTHWTRKGPRQNKANPRADSGGQGPPRLLVPPAGPIVRNKANSRADSSGPGPARLPVLPAGPIVRNEANSRTDGGGQGPATPPVPSVGPSVRNEANLPRADRKRRRPAGFPAKQSQFPGSGRHTEDTVKQVWPCHPAPPFRRSTAWQSAIVCRPDSAAGDCGLEMVLRGRTRYNGVV
jgi:hypothetical protein